MAQVTANTIAAVSTQGSGDVAELLMVIAVLIGLVVAGAVVAMLVKRSLDRRELDAAAPELGLIDQMRAMNRTGELSDEEFARAKQILADRASGVPSEEAKRRAEDAARRAAGILVADPGKDLAGVPLPVPQRDAIEPTLLEKDDNIRYSAAPPPPPSPSSGP